jgi:hypothetical protein
MSAGAVGLGRGAAQPRDVARHRDCHPAGVEVEDLQTASPPDLWRTVMLP